MRSDYLRVSLTDRCNLNCIYCRPKGRVKLIRREELLSFEEIVDFIKFLTNFGLRKVRLTGGEPLLRKDVVKLIEMIAGVEKIKDIALTTNGIILEKFARKLKKAGLSRVNISLDTLNKEKFIKITGSDKLPEVIRGIKAAKEAGLEPVKVNVVALKGLNDNEVLDFVDFALKNSLILRFIEYMPIKGVGDRNWHISNEKVKKIIERRWGRLEPVSFYGPGPARYFKFKKASLKLGFISPVTSPFCHTCSRLRLSADGKLKPCLVSDYEVDIKKALRDENESFRLKEIIDFVERYKAKKRKSCPNFDASGKFMFQIGG